MSTEADRKLLLESFAEELKKDRNRTEIIEITKLGLVEMTRKKVRMPLSRQLALNCSACKGTGIRMTLESVAYQVVREVWKRRRQGDTTAYCLKTGSHTAELIETIGIPEGGTVIIDRNGYEGSFDLSPITRKLSGNEDRL